MLHFFRQRGLMSVLYGAIMMATIMTFVIEFRPRAATKTASLTEACVARIRGRCIDPKAFGSAYRMLTPSRSAQQSRRMNLKRVALDGLIERELLMDEAKRLDITVTDEEVTAQLFAGFVRVSVPAANPVLAQTILQEMYQSYARAGLISQEVAMAQLSARDAAIPVDFRDPKTKSFDLKVYERQVRNLSNRSTTEFREEQERELLAAKMRDAIREPIRVSESELRDEYGRRYDTATVTSITVKESWARRWLAQIGDAAAWVKDHQQAYDAALKERIAQDSPKAGHVRHVLVKVAYGATDDEKSAALGKLSWAAGRLHAGESFAEVARDVSEDEGSAAQGGDVGEKTDGFVPPFKAAADALKAGETTTGAVETQFGYHLIMRDDPSKAAEVEAQVKRSLPAAMAAQAGAIDAAKHAAKAIAEAMRGGADADAAIRSVMPTEARVGKVETLRVLAPPAGAAGADAGLDGASVRDNAGAAGRDARNAPGKHGTDPAGARAPDAKGAHTPDPKGDRANDDQAAHPAAARFDASTDPDRPKAQTSSSFNKGGDPLPGLSPDATLSIASFAFAGKEHDVMAEPVRSAEGYLVVQLKERKRATRDEFDKNRESFEQELVRSKRDEALALYVRRLRERGRDNIRIDESYIQEASADGGAANPDEDEEEF